MIRFTKREKIVLLLWALALPIVFTIPQQTLNQYEFLWLIFFITPIGILIATDPERK